LKKKILAGIILLIVFGGFFGTAIATYPSGALAAMSNPWDAINQLFARIAELEKRLSIIEKLLGIRENNTKAKMEYPYLATLAVELEGKIEGKYNWEKEYSREWDEIKEEYQPPILINIKWNVFIKNLSNQTIRKIYYDIFVKDKAGNVLLDGSEIIVGREIGTTPEGKSYEIKYTLRETPIYTEVLPGGVTSFEGRAWIKTALEKAGIDLATDPDLKLEIVILQVKFE
jgi:rubrerythrin